MMQAPIISIFTKAAGSDPVPFSKSTTCSYTLLIDPWPIKAYFHYLDKDLVVGKHFHGQLHVSPLIWILYYLHFCWLHANYGFHIYDVLL